MHDYMHEVSIFIVLLVLQQCRLVCEWEHLQIRERDRKRGTDNITSQLLLIPYSYATLHMYSLRVVLLCAINHY